MKNVLVTGANRGLGLEFSRQYMADGWHVSAACRVPEVATALKDISREQPDLLSIYPLDLSSLGSIEKFCDLVQDTEFDLVINNAGVYGGSPQEIGLLDWDSWHNTMAVNAIAPILLAHKLLPQLSTKDNAKMVFITSKMGSMTDNTSGGAYLYRSSKAALNASIKSLALDLQGKPISVLALHPGWVKTDMGGPNSLIEPIESVTGMRQVIEEFAGDTESLFFDYRGNAIPW